MTSFIENASIGLAAAVAALALIAAAGWFAGRRTAGAIAMAAALAVALPWSKAQVGSASWGILPLTAAALLILWLIYERPRQARPKDTLTGLAITAFFATLAVVLTPQALALLVAVSLYYIVRDGARASLARICFVLLFPAVYLVLTFVRSAVWEGRALDVAWWCQMTVGQSWLTLRSPSGELKLTRYLAYLALYAPAFTALLAASWSRRGEWWSGPVFTWGAALVAGNLLFGRVVNPHSSLTMQMGIIVPIGLSLLREFRAPEGQPSFKPVAGPL